MSDGYYLPFQVWVWMRGEHDECEGTEFRGHLVAAFDEMPAANAYAKELDKNTWYEQVDVRCEEDEQV